MTGKQEDIFWYVVAVVLVSGIVVFGIVFTISYIGSRPVELYSRDEVVEMFLKDEAVFHTAVETGDYAPVEKLRYVQHVTVGTERVDFQCGGWGIAPSSHYYGVIWLKFGLSTITSTGWEVWGNGYEQIFDGNCYRYEHLGDNFFYYEIHT